MIVAITATSGERVVVSIWDVLTAIGIPGLLCFCGKACAEYYLAILDNATSSAGKKNREAYLDFCYRLQLGGTPVKLYAHWLKRALYVVDRFFGDLRQSTPRSVRKWFGLAEVPSPLWTAASFDRCLLLALIYPILSVVLIWIITGKVGPAEAALGIPPPPTV